MKSYDGGKTWQRKYMLDSIGYTEFTYTGNLYNFTFQQNKYGLFAVDRGSGKTYISYDGGDTWEKYSDVSAFFLDNDKNMYERGDTLFFFYNSYNSDPNITDKLVYYSLDTGRTWVMYDSLFLQKLPEKSSSLFVRNGQYYALKQDDLTLYQSTNEGNNWTEILKFQIPDTGKYTLFYVIPEKNLYFFTKSADSPIYITSDGGKSWNKMELPMPYYPQKWVEINGNIFIFYKDEYKELAYKNKKNVQFWVTRDFGKNWECLSKDLTVNIVTDIMPVEDYLYISTVEGLFRIKVDPVGVREQTEKVTLKPIELYPNPASNKVRIENNYYNLTNLQVFDIYGREQKISNYTSEEFDVTQLQTGIYIVKLTFDGSWYVAKKFIKI
jgi:photosystem II stability/assembly factor-like uncharacterized protein